MYSNPTAHSTVNLQDAYQRAVALQLLEMARQAPGENIKNVKLGKEMISPKLHEQLAGKRFEVIGA